MEVVCLPLEELWLTLDWYDAVKLSQTCHTALKYQSIYRPNLLEVYRYFQQAWYLLDNKGLLWLRDNISEYYSRALKQESEIRYWGGWTERIQGDCEFPSMHRDNGYAYKGLTFYIPAGTEFKAKVMFSGFKLAYYYSEPKSSDWVLHDQVFNRPLPINDMGDGIVYDSLEIRTNCPTDIHLVHWSRIKKSPAGDVPTFIVTSARHTWISRIMYLNMSMVTLLTFN